MKAIVAVDKNWGIGKNNGLLFELPLDMKFFRETTLNKTVVMGGNTLRSFPGGNPLKNRMNIVLSRKEKREDCIVAESLDALKEELKKREGEEVFVIGGEKIYKALLPFCKEVFVTKVDADGGADTFFENLDGLGNWRIKNESETLVTNGYNIKFTVYENSDVKEL